jgi:hypothetical protein
VHKRRERWLFDENWSLFVCLALWMDGWIVLSFFFDGWMDGWMDGLFFP